MGLNKKIDSKSLYKKVLKKSVDSKMSDESKLIRIQEVVEYITSYFMRRFNRQLTATDGDYFELRSNLSDLLPDHYQYRQHLRPNQGFTDFDVATRLRSFIQQLLNSSQENNVFNIRIIEIFNKYNWIAMFSQQIVQYSDSSSSSSSSGPPSH